MKLLAIAATVILIIAGVFVAGGTDGNYATAKSHPVEIKCTPLKPCV